MKYIVILCDGMADEPIEELGGRTPLMELEWEMKRLNRMDGIRLLFELFVAMLRL